MKEYSIKRFLSILIILFSLLTGVAMAKQSHPFSKNFTLEKDIRTSDPIKVQNRFGDVRIEVWGKQAVKVVVDVTGEAGEEENLETFYEELQENFIDLSKHVVVGPGISSYTNNTISLGNITRKRMKLEMKNGEKYEIGDIKVNYTVYLPDNHQLYTEVKYHNLDIKLYSGELTVTHYNGKVNIGEITAKSTISVKYGSLTINKGRDFSVNLYDGSLKLGSASKIFLSSKYSDIEIGILNEASLTSFEDDINIESIRTLQYNAKYSNLKSKGLTMLTATLYEGELEMGDIKTATINAKYADIKMGSIDALGFTSSYDCNFSADKIGKFSIGSSKYSDYQVRELTGDLAVISYDDDFSIDLIRATTSRIDINSKYGDYKLVMAKDHYHKLQATMQYGEIDFPNNYYTIDSNIKNGSSNILAAHHGANQQNSMLNIVSYSTDFEVMVK